MSIATDTAEAPSPAGNFVAAEPYPWPFDGSLSPRTTALVIIDMRPISAARAATSMPWGTI